MLALDTLSDLCIQAKVEETSAAIEEPEVQVADPFAFNMSSFGGGSAATTAPSKSKPSFSLMGNRPKPAAAEEAPKPAFSLMGKRQPVASQGPGDAFAFNMCAFGGFNSMAPPAAQKEVDTPTETDADKEDTNAEETVNFALVRTWQLMCSVQLIADYLLYWRTSRPSWTTFQDTLNREIDAVVRVCEGESFETSRLDRRLLRRSLLNCTRLSKRPEIRCALMLTVDCRAILPMLSGMTAELSAFIVSYAVPELHRKVYALPKPATKARIEFLATGLAECLQVLSSYRLPKACRPNAIQLAEYICVLYGALYIIAWHERDLSMVLRLLSHKPLAPLWSRIGPSCDTAIGAWPHHHGHCHPRHAHCSLRLSSGRNESTAPFCCLAHPWSA